MVQLKLKALLAENNLNQDVIAKIIKKTRETTNHKINGRIPFTLEEAFLISNYFDMPIEEIFLTKIFTPSEKTNMEE